MGGQEASENKTRAVNEKRLRREEGGTDSRVFHHQDATAPGGFGPDGPATRVLQDDGDRVGRLEREGVGVGGVVGDERGTHLRTAQCRALRSRRVIKSSELKSMECCAGDLMKTTKTLLTLRPLEQDNGLWPKTMSKA